MFKSVPQSAKGSPCQHKLMLQGCAQPDCFKELYSAILYMFRKPSELNVNELRTAISKTWPDVAALFPGIFNKKNYRAFTFNLSSFT